MCKRRGVITHYLHGRPPERHAVSLTKHGAIKISGASWSDVLSDPMSWTFGNVERGELLNYVRELAAAQRRWRSVYV